MQEGAFSSPGLAAVTGLLRGDVYAADCPTRLLLDRIGDKWSVLALSLLNERALRFNQLKRAVQGVSQKMLSQTLRALERDGLVARAVAATVPVSVTYSLTPLGRSLVAALLPVVDWAETHMGQVADAQCAYDARD